jgi:hypothetical protein
MLLTWLDESVLTEPLIGDSSGSPTVRSGDLTTATDADLIGWWKLDGNANDSAGINHGILVGDLQWVSEGYDGGALSFDETTGDANYVEISTADISLSAGTVTIWAKLAPDPQPRTTRYFFGHTTIPVWNNRIQLYMDESDTWLDLGLGDSHFRQEDIINLTTETWYHIALTWDGSNYVVYVNGQDKANGSYTGLDALNTVADIGNNGGNDDDRGRTEAFNGLLDDVTIWDIALTAKDVLDIYNFEVDYLLDPNAPAVYAGPDMIIASELSVDMDATVVNRDTQDPNRLLSYEWTAIPSAGVVFEPNEFFEDPTVTITDPNPNDPTTYKLTLSAQLINPSGPPEEAMANSMEIDLYADACKAEIAAGLAWPYDSGDVNTDCITALEDIAILAEKWFEEYALDEPAIKP